MFWKDRLLVILRMTRLIDKSYLEKEGRSMSWVDLIKEVVPFNEQEREDKEATLKYINMFDDILKRENEIMHITSSGIVINKNKDKV